MALIVRAHRRTETESKEKREIFYVGALLLAPAKLDAIYNKFILRPLCSRFGGDKNFCASGRNAHTRNKQAKREKAAAIAVR